MSAVRRVLAGLRRHRALLALDGMASASRRAWAWLLTTPKPIRPRRPRIFYLGVAALYYGSQLVADVLPRPAARVIGVVLWVVVAACAAWLAYALVISPAVRRIGSKR